MSFTSPWQSRAFVRSVDAIRRVLRPFGELESRFIAWLAEMQNRRVHRYLSDSRPGTVLLIMPRCVKLTGCRADVQNSLEQCRDCSLCPLGDVARLCERFDIRALVAFRSHIAFDLARRHDPDLIVATACHDRLVKALRSVPEYPALLAPLTGMQKQCVNAGVDLDWLEKQLAILTHGEPAPIAFAVNRPLSGDGCPARSSARAAEGS